MRGGRTTKLALLALVALAVVTGTASYAVGTAPATSVLTAAHAAAGLALVLLVPGSGPSRGAGCPVRRTPGAGRESLSPSCWR